LWCGLFFLALALENGILFIDLVIVPEIDLSSIHIAIALVGTLLLLYGLVWEIR
jgi:hypothetical protein